MSVFILSLHLNNTFIIVHAFKLYVNNVGWYGCSPLQLAFFIQCYIFEIHPSRQVRL